MAIQVCTRLLVVLLIAAAFSETLSSTLVKDVKMRMQNYQKN